MASGSVGGVLLQRAENGTLLLGFPGFPGLASEVAVLSGRPVQQLAESGVGDRRGVWMGPRA